MKFVEISCLNEAGFVGLIPINQNDYESYIDLCITGPKHGIRAAIGLDRGAVSLLIAELQRMEKEIWGK